MKVKDQIELIKKQENGRTHNIYVCIRGKFNTKDFSIRYPQLVDGKRCYREDDFIMFAKDYKLEYDDEVKDLIVTQEQGDSFGFNGFTGTFTYNEYWIYIDKLHKGNKGKRMVTKTTYIPFTDEELKGKRFTL